MVEQLEVWEREPRIQNQLMFGSPQVGTTYFDYCYLVEKSEVQKDAICNIYAKIALFSGLFNWHASRSWITFESLLTDFAKVCIF